jgi:hypothetical protein
VVEANTPAPIVNAGKLASALIIHCNNIVQALPSVQATTTIQSTHLASHVAAAATLISTASRLESSLSNVTKSQNA